MKVEKLQEESRKQSETSQHARRPSRPPRDASDDQDGRNAEGGQRRASAGRGHPAAFVPAGGNGERCSRWGRRSGGPREGSAPELPRLRASRSTSGQKSLTRNPCPHVNVHGSGITGAKSGEGPKRPPAGQRTSRTRPLTRVPGRAAQRCGWTHNVTLNGTTRSQRPGGKSPQHTSGDGLVFKTHKELLGFL